MPSPVTAFDNFILRKLKDLENSDSAIRRNEINGMCG